ncbi:MAG: putative membrane protein [Candidatus Binatia bacterium]|jgi:uncharacterized membrane protein
MNSIFPLENDWTLWAVIVGGVAVCIHLEQGKAWAARISGPVLALVGAMLLTACGIMPTKAPAYEVVGDYLVPLAIPLLLFRANLRRIWKDTGTMMAAFHISVAGTFLGGFLAALIFHDGLEATPEIAGIMTASYSGGSVNFVAVKDSYDLSENIANPLIVADNFIMAGMFIMLLWMAGSQFFLKRFPHPHTTETDPSKSASLAAEYWKRKPMGLRDIATALGVAFAITAVAMGLSNAIKATFESQIAQLFLGNVYVLITVITVTITTLWHDNIKRIHGAEEIGMYLLYLFFFVIGLSADLWQVIFNMPTLFGFCLVMAVTNLVVTLSLGKLFKLPLEELLVSINATLGGPPSAAAMAIAKGWSGLVLPGLLVGIWGYVIGTTLGIMMAEGLMRIW